MQLKAFRVRKFRNIEDSGEVELPDVLTCVVGKNQSGKSSLLRALHKFNPRFPEPYDMRREWPRGQRHQRNEQQVVCEVRFRLSSEELKKLGEIAGQELRGEDVVVTKDYKGNFKVQFPEDSPLFPSTLNSNLIDAIYQDLPAPTQPVDENFRTQAIKCNLEAKKYAKNGRFEELNRQVRARHVAALHKQLTDVKTAPQWVNENQFIEDYKAALTEFKAKIATESTKQQKAHDYIVSQLPTFIYMDDYKAFRGRSDLEGLKERLHNKKLVLSEEDETFLMILKLGSLDLDNLIKQGNSEDQEVLHDRQIDLQDAATTLTSNVAGRWGQHEYQLQFRADGQVFFTEIEETNKNIGMIPLEEQSKGFQWFFSFDLHFMHDSEGTFEGCVLLLDEPGLHLHPGGQMDLLDRLDAYARKNTLIYTTHLPFLVDLREPKRLKVIQQTEMGAIVSDDLGGTQTDERLTLQAALGMSANQGCLVSKRNLLVEGVHDYWIIAELSNIFEREGHVCLPEDVLVTAAGGESEIVHTAMFMLGQKLTVVALFDSDSAGNLAEGKLRNKWITRYKNAQAVTVLFADALGMPGKEATIEDLFPEDYYMEKVRKSHALKLLSKGLASEEITLNGSGPVLPRLQQCFDKLEVDFNKGLVGKLIRRDLIRCNSVGSLPPGVAEKGAALLTVLRTAFDNFDKQTSKEERAVGKKIDQQIAKAERSNGGAHRGGLGNGPEGKGALEVAGIPAQGRVDTVGALSAALAGERGAGPGAVRDDQPGPRLLAGAAERSFHAVSRRAAVGWNPRKENDHAAPIAAIARAHREARAGSGRKRAALCGIPARSLPPEVGARRNQHADSESRTSGPDFTTDAGEPQDGGARRGCRTEGVRRGSTAPRHGHARGDAAGSEVVGSPGPDRHPPERGKPRRERAYR